MSRPLSSPLQKSPRIARKSAPDLQQESVVRVRSVAHKKKRASPSSAPLPTAAIKTPPPEANRNGFMLHAGAAVAAVIAIVVLSRGALRDSAPSLTAQLLPPDSRAAPATRIEIGLEHAKPVTVSLSLTTNGARGIADLRHDALETLHVSLPSEWIRREVGGVPLASVTADPSTFGFTRWSVPAGATVSFDVAPPSSILLHNPSGIPAEIRITRVNLQTQEAERDIILIQEGSAVLW